MSNSYFRSIERKEYSPTRPDDDNLRFRQRRLEFQVSGEARHQHKFRCLAKFDARLVPVYDMPLSILFDPLGGEDTTSSPKFLEFENMKQTVESRFAHGREIEVINEPKTIGDFPSGNAVEVSSKIAKLDAKFLIWFLLDL